MKGKDLCSCDLGFFVGPSLKIKSSIKIWAHSVNRSPYLLPPNALLKKNDLIHSNKSLINMSSEICAGKKCQIQEAILKEMEQRNTLPGKWCHEVKIVILEYWEAFLLSVSKGNPMHGQIPTCTPCVWHTLHLITAFYPHSAAHKLFSSSVDDIYKQTRQFSDDYTLNRLLI